MLVGEGGPSHRDDVPHRRVTAWLPNTEVDEIVIHEVVDGRKVPAIPDQVKEPPDDRAVVLLESHKTVPPLPACPGARLAPVLSDSQEVSMTCSDSRAP